MRASSLSTPRLACWWASRLTDKAREDTRLPVLGLDYPARAGTVVVMQDRRDRSYSALFGAGWLGALVAHDLGYLGSSHDHAHVGPLTLLPPLFLLAWGLAGHRRVRLRFRQIVALQLVGLAVLESSEWLIGGGPAATGLMSLAIVLAIVPLSAAAFALVARVVCDAGPHLLFGGIVAITLRTRCRFPVVAVPSSRGSVGIVRSRAPPASSLFA